MVWLSEKIPLLEKPGIIYCGTRAEVENTNKWLKMLGWIQQHIMQDLIPLKEDK